MRSRHIAALLLVVATAPFPARAGDGSATGGGNSKLSLALEPSALLVSGAEASTQIAWFGVASTLDADFSVARAASQGLAQAGIDGIVRIALTKPIPERGIWVAVDVKSGDFSAVTPQGYRLNRLDRDHTPCHGDAGKGDDGVADGRQQIEGLMVRPGVGAWRFAVADGGTDDEDGKHDGHLRRSLAKFEPVGDSPAAPSKLQGDDLWFVIDPVAMDLSVLKGGIAQ